MNGWMRAPYIYDAGLIDDNTSDLTPSLAAIAAGATPGFRPAPPGTGSVISQFRHLRHNFIIANYNSYDTMETDDGSSRYILSSSKIVMLSRFACCPSR